MCCHSDLNPSCFDQLLFPSFKFRATLVWFISLGSENVYLQEKRAIVVFQMFLDSKSHNTLLLLMLLKAPSKAVQTPESKTLQIARRFSSPCSLISILKETSEPNVFLLAFSIPVNSASSYSVLEKINGEGGKREKSKYCGSSKTYRFSSA